MCFQKMSLFLKLKLTETKMAKQNRTDLIKNRNFCPSEENS